MTPERTALMLTDETEHCKFCKDPIRGEATVFDKYDEPFCNQECFENAEIARAEDLHEEKLAAFHGGSQAFTAEEKYREAAEEKRRLG